VYTPLPPENSSARTFGAFGRGASLFDESIYQSLNYPALLESLKATGLPLRLFIAVGDDEWKNPDPAKRRHDVDIQAQRLLSQVACIPAVTAEFRVYAGGHDWGVWEPAFVDGIQFLTR
jgi:hypothetical protein